MQMLVPLSYFFGEPRSEIWQLDTSTGIKRLLCTLASTGREVRGKGITGLAWFDDRHLVACDFNRLIKLDRRSLCTISSYEDDELNDLHGLSVDQGCIYVVNAGRDSIDVFNHQFDLLCRIDGLHNEEWEKRKVGDYSTNGSYFDTPNSNVAFHRRRVPDKWHFNHVFKAPADLGGQVIATSFTSRSLLDAHTLESVSSVLPAQPHDGIIYDGHLWVTTVSGQIYRSPFKIPFQFELVFELFKEAEYQGWCRGLLISDGYMFVGITSIYEIGARTDWLTGSLEATRSGVYQLNFNSMEIETFHDFSSLDGSRIFTMVADR